MTIQQNNTMEEKLDKQFEKIIKTYLNHIKSGCNINMLGYILLDIKRLRHYSQRAMQKQKFLAEQSLVERIKSEIKDIDFSNAEHPYCGEEYIVFIDGVRKTKNKVLSLQSLSINNKEK